MTQGRFVVIIVIVTFLGLVTVWQQVQTLQWGYNISETESAKKRIMEEHKTLSLQLSQVKSPPQLLELARTRQIILDYPQQVKTPNRQAGIIQNNRRLAGLREQ